MIPLGDVYSKAVNFLIGSGASSGLFPTLELRLTKDDEMRWSLEELGAHLAASNDRRYIPLFMHYYSECILPVAAQGAGEPVRGSLRSLIQQLSAALTQQGLAVNNDILEGDQRTNIHKSQYVPE